MQALSATCSAEIFGSSCQNLSTSDNNANGVRKTVRNQDTKATQKKKKELKVKNTIAAGGQLCSNIPTFA